LGDEDDFMPLLAQWLELLNPSKVDWINLLHQIKDKNSSLYFKVAETLLSEKSFEADTKDYTNLIDLHVKNKRLEDALRIVSKMRENGIVSDLLAQTTMIQLYCEAGMMDKAHANLDSLNSQGFKSNISVYNSMVMGYMKTNDWRYFQKLITQMRTMNMKPTKEIYMAVLRTYAQNGMCEDAQTTHNAMYFDGFEPDFESCGLMVEAYARYNYKETVEPHGKFGQQTQPGKGGSIGASVAGAKYHFEDMTARAFKHDDWTTSCMMIAYKKVDNLDEAVKVLLALEEQGFEAGVLTYTVLLEWFCLLGLVDEAEQVLTKMASLPETPSYKIHVSLLEMYSNAKVEAENKGRVLEGQEAGKKALEHVRVLEGKKDQLSADDFDRITLALKKPFKEDFSRFCDMMRARGFTLSAAVDLVLRTIPSLSSSDSTRRNMKPTRS
jgi:pentatricopeptide repeat protein